MKERGVCKPLFFMEMIREDEIKMLIDKVVEGTGIFPVHIKVSPGSKIKVLLDADPGLSIEDCVRVSRFIEHHLDRESEDFSLDVSSPGLDMPLKVWKQYEKNTGRSLRVTLLDESCFDGILIKAENGLLEFEVEKIIHKKPLLEAVKKKNTIQLKESEISEAKVNIKFK